MATVMNNRTSMGVLDAVLHLHDGWKKGTINTEPCEELTKDETALTPEDTQFV